MFSPGSWGLFGSASPLPEGREEGEETDSAGVAATDVDAKEADDLGEQGEDEQPVLTTTFLHELEAAFDVLQSHGNGAKPHTWEDFEVGKAFDVFYTFDQRQYSITYNPSDPYHGVKDYEWRPGQVVKRKTQDMAVCFQFMDTEEDECESYEKKERTEDAHEQQTDSDRHPLLSSCSPLLSSVRWIYTNAFPEQIAPFGTFTASSSDSKDHPHSGKVYQFQRKRRRRLQDACEHFLEIVERWLEHIQIEAFTTGEGSRSHKFQTLYKHADKAIDDFRAFIFKTVFKNPKIYGGKAQRPRRQVLHLISRTLDKQLTVAGSYLQN